MASYFSDNQLHVDKLKLMASSTAEGLSDYFDYCERERRNLYEVLYDFDSVKMPFEYILEICRIVHFREYSVTHFDMG